MSGTERNETGACDRSANADGAKTDTAYEACIAADRGPQEKQSTMQPIKEMIAAPERAAAPPNADGTERCAPAALPPDLPGHLGAQLRAIYGALVCEPVPERFFHLLKELEAKEQEGKS
jgi:hypothetical protein